MTLRTPNTFDELERMAREAVEGVTEQMKVALQPLAERLAGAEGEERRHLLDRYAETEHAWRVAREPFVRQLANILSLRPMPPMIIEVPK